MPSMSRCSWCMGSQVSSKGLSSTKDRPVLAPRLVWLKTRAPRRALAPTRASEHQGNFNGVYPHHLNTCGFAPGHDQGCPNALYPHHFNQARVSQAIRMGNLPMHLTQLRPTSARNKRKYRGCTSAASNEEGVITSALEHEKDDQTPSS